jgi:hypothetical protein
MMGVCEARARRRVAACGAAALLAGACGGAEPAPRVPSSSAPGTTAAEPESGGLPRWAKFRSKRFALTLALPDGKTWAIDDHSFPELRAKSGALDADVVVYAFHDTALVNYAKCDQRARDLGLVGEREESVEDEVATHPAGFDAHARVSVERIPGRFVGHVSWVGAKVRQCVIVRYNVRREDERVLGDHLAEVRVGFLSGLAIDAERTTVDADVPRQRLR